MSDEAEQDGGSGVDEFADVHLVEGEQTRTRLDTLARHPIASGAVAAIVAGVVLALLGPLLPDDPPSTAERVGATPPPGASPSDSASESVAPAVLAAVTYGVDERVRQWYLPSLPELGDPPLPNRDADPGQVQAYAEANGGVRLPDHVRLTFEGNADSPIVITDARARVVEQEGLPGGLIEVVRPPPVATSSGVERTIDFQLDLDDGVARAMKPAASDSSLSGATDVTPEPFFADQTVSLAPNEVVTFDVDVAATRCRCRWELVLDVVVAGQDEEIVVRDGDRPLETYGTSGLPVLRSWPS